MTLQWLLDPVTPDSFLAEVWAKDHLRISRGNTDYFSALLTPEAIEQFICFGRPEAGVVRLVRGADKKGLEAYQLPGGGIDMVALRSDFLSGYTIVLNGLERYIPMIARLAHAIEIDLNFEVQVNAYVTPPGSQGFLAHYDDHDVLVTQVSGRKKWYVYENLPDVPPRELRLRENFVADGLTGATEMVLEAGDVLYVPRGRVHAAETLDDASVHLTFGVHPPSFLSLVTEALDSMAIRDDRILERLPPRYLSDQSVRAKLGALVDDLTRAIDSRAINDAIGTLEDRLLRRGRCGNAGQLLETAISGADLADSSRVTKPGPVYSRVLALGEQVGLQFAQSLVTAEPDHLEALLYLSRAREPFKVADIPGLEEQDRTILARQLLLDGFLVRAEAA
jgi:lysine-specific demethylase/histidyl-hydroxylase NO66